MAGFFTALIFANEADPGFTFLWCCFGAFCLWVLGIVIVSVRHYRRTRKRKRNELEAEERERDMEMEGARLATTGPFSAELGEVEPEVDPA